MLFPPQPPTLDKPQSRRTFLQVAGACTGAAIAGFPSFVQGSPKATILETKVISKQPHYYNGWPTVARRANGELWLTWSGGRENHICPFGQVHSMTSRDNGETWTWPRVLLDSATDDRDSGVMETVKGTLLVTTFTSLAYKPILERANLPPERLARWKACEARLTDEERQADVGEWLIRSTDGGKTWSPRLPTIVNSPHGPLQLSNGRLLYAGKKLWSDQKIGVCESKDDGLTWQWLAEIPTRNGDAFKEGYHELHAIEASNGKLLVQIRNQGKNANSGETLQTESTDGGKTWSEPHPIGVWGLPSHLLKLRDGRLLMTYGHRRSLFGNQARLSIDDGQTWGEAMSISEDGIQGDLGYPSTVELGDGSLLTVWYESMLEPKLAVLRQARWMLK